MQFAVYNTTLFLKDNLYVITITTILHDDPRQKERTKTK